MISFATKQDIEAALIAIRTTMNCVAVYFEAGEVMYQLSSMPHGASSLIHSLRKAENYNEQLKQSERSLFKVRDPQMESASLSESSPANDWLRPEEDEAWQNLQSKEN